MGHPPSVDALARGIAEVGLPHPLLVEAVREAIAAGDASSARSRAEAVRRLLVGPVINATGVLLHTNLGRAPIEIHQPASYLNLEIDLVTGRRGRRAGAVPSMLALATGAEAALVVNNGAAAVLLVLAALAAGSRVAISRGELVEIGGGFRIPEVLAASGVHLVEVGTTNRTRLDDYRCDADLILKVHQSNYRIVGFTESVGVRELKTLGIAVVYDLGSGLLDSATPWLSDGPPPWLAGEPAVRQSIEAGADLITFSGDKLFGGPQAGIIVGQDSMVQACARHPLARALRPGAMVLAALQETVMSYLRRDGTSIPFWRMAAASIGELTDRANALGVGDTVLCSSVAGGGSAPGLEIPSAGVALPGDRTAALREAPVPIIARAQDGRTILDLRTVDPRDDSALAGVVTGLT